MASVYSLGVMTGTSCDGADLALLKFSLRKGVVTETLQHSLSRGFPAALRLRLLFAQTGALTIAQTAALTRDYSRWLGETCSRALSAWKVPRANTLLAVHGQTVWHAPEASLSVQLLEPSLVAYLTSCTVTAAFRQPDLARGGEGAPSVPLYHWLRATSSKFRSQLPFAIHNIGGIANLTYVTRDRAKILAFDTGPGNALIDMATEEASDGKLKFDRDGQLAQSAFEQIDWQAIERLGAQPYFRKPPPKSTGRELFSRDYLKQLPGAGAAKVANATALTAHTMAAAYSNFVLDGKRRLRQIYVAGGGARNPVLMRLFSQDLERRAPDTRIQVSALPNSFAPPQYLEAMAFARLGFEAIQGRPVSLAAVTGAREDAIGAGVFPAKNYRRLLKLLNVL